MARKSLRRLEDALLPWVVTKVDQEDDVGRDAFIQVFDENGDGRTIAAPLSFAAQVKASRLSFGDVAAVQVKTRHLRLWSEGDQVWVFAYSEADDRFRVRSGRDLAREADAIRPDWREGEAVTLRFPPESELGTAISLAEIRRRLADVVDARGGATTFHSQRRRVLLTDLFVVGRKYQTTTKGLAASETGEQIVLLEGPGWIDGDLLPDDVDAARELAAALLLYEEVWVLAGYLASVLAVTGSRPRRFTSAAAAGASREHAAGRVDGPRTL